MSSESYKVELYIPKVDKPKKDKRTEERAAALRMIAKWRNWSCYPMARACYREFVKPFPRKSPEAVALRRIAELADAAAGRDWTPLVERINEIARGWK